jgi:hypothetical protein
MPFSVTVNCERKSFTISVGDFIWFSGREEGQGVLITKIFGDEDSGPKWISYLPWRYETSCWESPRNSLLGDHRFLVCYPSEHTHYGVHIDWSTVVNMEPIDHPIFSERVASILKK